MTQNQVEIKLLQIALALILNLLWKRIIIKISDIKQLSFSLFLCQPFPFEIKKRERKKNLFYELVADTNSDFHTGCVYSTVCVHDNLFAENATVA